MKRLLKIDNIMFFVKDLATSAKFYEGVLGLKKVWTDEKRGMMGFIFSQSDSEIVIYDDSTVPSPDFSFLVEDVEEFCREFQKEGYEVIDGPIEVRCGKFAVLSDLNKNRVPIIDLTKFGGKPKYN